MLKNKSYTIYIFCTAIDFQSYNKTLLCNVHTNLQKRGNDILGPSQSTQDRTHTFSQSISSQTFHDKVYCSFSLTLNYCSSNCALFVYEAVKRHSLLTIFLSQYIFIFPFSASQNTCVLQWLLLEGKAVSNNTGSILSCTVCIMWEWMPSIESPPSLPNLSVVMMYEYYTDEHGTCERN